MKHCRDSSECRCGFAKRYATIGGEDSEYVIVRKSADKAKRRKARDFSGTLERESPSRGRGQNRERVMMKQVIILVILLVISLPAY